MLPQTRQSAREQPEHQRSLRGRVAFHELGVDTGLDERALITHAHLAGVQSFG